MTMPRWVGRTLLILELLVGLLPVTALYLYLFPAGLFWAGQVGQAARRGILNPFTIVMVGVFVAGGIGLAGAWWVILRRIRGDGAPGRVARWGLVLGAAAAAVLLVIMARIGGVAIDYYLYGAPLAVAIHHLAASWLPGFRRWRSRTPTAAVSLAILAAIAGADAAAAATDGRPRVPAEWEPALGAMVAWPPIVPDALLVEIAKDDRLFLLVEDEKARKEAEAAVARLRIDPAKVRFIVAEAGDGRPWTRDWGPFPLFDAQGTFHLAGRRFVDYPSATSRCDGRLFSQRALFFLDFAADEAATDIVARSLGVPGLRLPFALTGGNALVDGLGTAFSTCVMLAENRRYLGIDERAFHRAIEEQLGISRYIVVPNFEWFGIQHIDCLLKPIDEETILVKRVPEGHPDHEAIESTVRYLASLTNPRGRPYRIRRIDTPPYLFGFFVPNYTNSLILNRKVLVPFYGIPADRKAVEAWREALPGYEVLGFRNDTRYDWNWLDALHCRVRAVWDAGMLYMSHRRIDDRVAPAPSYPVEVLIRDYSGSGIVADELLLSWRLRGETDWHPVPLAAGSAPDTYAAAIPSPGAGRAVEYFLSAADRSGRRETLPRVAPRGFYTFTVESAVSAP